MAKFAAKTYTRNTPSPIVRAIYALRRCGQPHRPVAETAESRPRRSHSHTPSRATMHPELTAQLNPSR